MKEGLYMELLRKFEKAVNFVRGEQMRGKIVNAYLIEEERQTSRIIVQS